MNSAAAGNSPGTAVRAVTGSAARRVTIVRSRSSSPATLPSASTTASCSPTPEEYQPRSRKTRRPPPDRARVLVRPRLADDSVQPKVGTIQAGCGGSGRAVLGRSTTSGWPELGRLTGSATMATSTVPLFGMAPDAIRAMVPWTSSTV